MRIGTVSLVVALTLAVLASPAPAQVASGPLRIDVVADLEPVTGVDDRTVFLLNGTARLSLLVEGELDAAGLIALSLGAGDGTSEFAGTIDLHDHEHPGDTLAKMHCTGTVDRTGTGSGRCASSGQFDGAGTWAGRIDVQERSVTLTMFLHVVCPRCAAR